jgi:SAM-dependent methyltransferase
MKVSVLELDNIVVSCLRSRQTSRADEIVSLIGLGGGVQGFGCIVLPGPRQQPARPKGNAMLLLSMPRRGPWRSPGRSAPRRGLGAVACRRAVDGPFDTAISCFTSFGYDHDEENRQVLADYRRLLRPDGRLLLETRNPCGLSAGEAWGAPTYPTAASDGTHSTRRTNQRPPTTLRRVEPVRASRLGVGPFGQQGPLEPLDFAPIHGYQHHEHARPTLRRRRC